MIQQFIEWVRRIFRRRPQEKEAALDAQDYAQKYEDTGRVNFTAIFANKLTNLVVAESTVSVTGDGKRAEFICTAIQDVWDKAQKITAQAFGKGGKVIVPYIDNGVARFAAIDQYRMTINEMRGDQIVSATMLADRIDRGNGEKFFRLSDYSLVGNTHYIVNRAVNESGNPVNMQEFPEWENIAEEIAIANVDRLLFAFIRCSVDNRVDRDAYGVPVTFGSESIMAEAQEHIDIIRREYRLTRPMLGLDSSLWRKRKSKDEDGNPLPFGKTIEDVRTTVQDSNFPFIPVDTIDGDQPWLMFAPAIRDTALHTRLNELYERMEKSVGTSKGILTERTSKGATATEIRAAMYDTFCITAAMRNQWSKALDDLAYAWDVLAEYYGATPAGSRGDYDVSADWDYSMYESSAETFSQLSELQSRGMVSKAELRQWVKGGTLEEAKEAIDAIDEAQPTTGIFGE